MILHLVKVGIILATLCTVEEFICYNKSVV